MMHRRDNEDPLPSRRLDPESERELEDQRRRVHNHLFGPQEQEDEQAQTSEEAVAPSKPEPPAP